MLDIIDGQDLIDGFVKLLPSRPTRAANVASPLSAIQTPTKSPNPELLKLAQAEPLFDGQWQHRGAGVSINPSRYPSPSEADFALLGAIVRHARQLGIPETEVSEEALLVFEQSGLYRSEKRNRVIKQDLPKLVASTYTQPPPTQPAVQFAATGPRLQSGRIALLSAPPPPRDYVLEDLILNEKVSVLAGLGGVSKTMFLMTLATHIALGLPFLGKATKQGCVLLVLGEEDKSEIDRRFGAIAEAHNLTTAERALVAERVRAYPLDGLDARFTKFDGKNLVGTDFPAEIEAAAQKLEAEAGLELALLGLDHIGLIHGGEFNAREHVIPTMQITGGLAAKIKAATLVLAHSPKASLGKDQSDVNDVAGSTAFTDLSRCVLVLRTMTEAEGKEFNVAGPMQKSYVSLSVVKNNYGPTGDKHWTIKAVVPSYGVSVLHAAQLTKPLPNSKSTRLLADIKAFIKQFPGQYSKTGLRDTKAGKAGQFNASKADVAAAIEDMLASGELKLVTPTDAQRKQFGLRRQIQVLEAV